MERRQGLDEVISRKQTDSFRQTTPEAVLSWKEQRQLTRKNHETIWPLVIKKFCANEGASSRLIEQHEISKIIKE